MWGGSLGRCTCEVHGWSLLVNPKIMQEKDVQSQQAVHIDLMIDTLCLDRKILLHFYGLSYIIIGQKTSSITYLFTKARRLRIHNRETMAASAQVSTKLSWLERAELHKFVSQGSNRFGADEVSVWECCTWLPSSWMSTTGQGQPQDTKGLPEATHPCFLLNILLSFETFSNHSVLQFSWSYLHCSLDPQWKGARDSQPKTVASNQKHSSIKVGR